MSGSPQLLPLPGLPQRGEVLAGVRLPGRPQVAQRHRARVAWRKADGGKPAPYVHTYMDSEYRFWLEGAVDQLRGWWAGKAPILEPVVGQVVAVLTRPQQAVRHYTCRGERQPYPFNWTDGRNPHVGLEDMDNLRKAAWDALVQADVLGDDRLIVRDRGEKYYAAVGERPCVEIKLWRA